MDISNKTKLIETDEAIRGGIPTHDIPQEDDMYYEEIEKERVSSLSDNDPLKTLAFLFASLNLENVDHFSYSFFLEIILIDLRIFYDDQGKEKVKEVMKEISRHNTIESVKYVELKDNQFELKILYEDNKEANVTLQLEKGVSVIYENEPTYYYVVTPPSEIIEQIKTTIQ